MLNLTDPKIERAEKFGSRANVQAYEPGPVMVRGKRLSYIERLRKYEADKRQLWSTNISAAQYEKEIKKLRAKWNV